jgi:photosystem II stability/assembly factor-like uncharacterized protein
MVNATTGWAVGYWGEILRYRNARWSVFYSWPTEYLQDVDFGTANFGMAVGKGGAGAVFNGTIWKSAAVPTTADMFGVNVPPGQNSVAWAVGAAGNLWRWSGGANGYWSRWNVGITAPLHDVYFSSMTDGWFCGNRGRVSHFAGAQWSAVNAATTADFFCIYALSENNVWAGGTGGTLFHYEGVSWVRTATPTTNTIREMAFNGPIDGWAVCDGGVVLRYDGISWKKVTTKPATTENFSGMYMVDTQTGWAVGQNGTIYEYRNYAAVAPSSLGKVKALFE